jgi:hypothetical protein
MVRDGPPLSPDDRGRGRLQPVSTEATGALHDEIEWEQCGDLRGQLASPVGHTAPRVRQSDAARNGKRPTADCSALIRDGWRLRARCVCPRPQGPTHQARAAACGSGALPAARRSESISSADIKVTATPRRDYAPKLRTKWSRAEQLGR